MAWLMKAVLVGEGELLAVMYEGRSAALAALARSAAKAVLRTLMVACLQGTSAGRCGRRSIIAGGGGDQAWIGFYRRLMIRLIVELWSRRLRSSELTRKEWNVGKT